MSYLITRLYRNSAERNASLLLKQLLLELGELEELRAALAVTPRFPLMHGHFAYGQYVTFSITVCRRSRVQPTALQMRFCFRLGARPYGFLWILRFASTERIL